MQRDEVLAVLRAHRDELRERFGVESIRLFGSVARGESSSDGDIDVLVDFGGPTGFTQYMDLLFRLEELLGAKVDLVTARGLREELRPNVEREAVRVV
jgi:predicted nucleotidyltransferase